jgi:hypothetical protein
MSRLNLEITYGLAGVADGWTDEHYLKFKVFDVNLATRFQAEMDDSDDSEQAAVEITKKYVKGQFVGGKVLVDGTTVDAEAGDIDDLPTPLLRQILLLVARSTFADPKAGTR